MRKCVILYREVTYVAFYSLSIDSIALSARVDAGLSFSELAAGLAVLTTAQGETYSLVEITARISGSVAANITGVMSTTRSAALLCNQAVSESQYASFSVAITESILNSFSVSASASGMSLNNIPLIFGACNQICYIQPHSYITVSSLNASLIEVIMLGVTEVFVQETR